MNDRLIALLRTYFPVAWSALIAWLVSLGVPASVTSWASGMGGFVLATAITVVVYPVLRWLESRAWFPDWLTRVFLGSAKPPTYALAVQGAHAAGAPFGPAGDGGGTGPRPGSGSTSTDA